MDELAPRGANHVLIVDDDAGVLASLDRLLRAAGLPVTCAAGGAAAISLLAGFTPDLVLLDLSMPRVDGFAVLRHIRADPRTAAVPVILFSAMSDRALRQRAIDAGANDFWSKVGFDYATLPRRLLALMGS
jgi:CheY-like chemotaxis protein